MAQKHVKTVDRSEALRALNAAPPTVYQAPELPKSEHKREREPSVFDDHVKNSLDNGVALHADAPDEETAKVYAAEIRRSANFLEAGVKVRTKVEDGVHRVYFQATKERMTRNRRYSAADIRTWAAENDIELEDGKRIPVEVRDAFKNANGYA